MSSRNVLPLPLEVCQTPVSWTKSQQQILDLFEQEENRQLPVRTLCQRAGVSTIVWYRAVKDPRFAAAVEALGGAVKRTAEAHILVSLATHPEEELAKDIWDMRRLKSDYPKHKNPAEFRVNFTWIANPCLRQQVKDYFRHHLPQWKPKTFVNHLYAMRPFLQLLAPEMHVGTIERQHVEELLPQVYQLGDQVAWRCLQMVKEMFTYMTISPAWTGPRPPRGLIWDEEIPRRPDTLPRPVPPDVLDQFDALLELAVAAMKAGKSPDLLPPRLWDALLFLRRTGDLAHLKGPNKQGRNGCLDQDSEGYWWLRIDHQHTKLGRDHRIPTRMSDGVIDAVHRQQERSTNVPDHFDAHYLFRTDQGTLTYGEVERALEKLAAHLLHDGHCYRISPHQFRHSIATDMIEQGVDIYTVKEFLGHRSLGMTEKYVQVYLTSLKAKYDAYRVKKQQTYASQMMVNQVHLSQPEGEADGGWVENKVGKLYVSPLPDGIGNCVHLPMHDGCPDSPHCPTCPKLRANKRHLPVWESKATNLLITVEALRANPAYARVRQKHE